MRVLAAILLAACGPLPKDPQSIPPFAVEWNGGVYGTALPDGGIGPVPADAGDDALVPVPCPYGGTLTGPTQLYSHGIWEGVGRVVVGQYEWCDGAFSGNDLNGMYGYGDEPGTYGDGFSAIMTEGRQGGIAVYHGHFTDHRIEGIASGLGLHEYRYLLKR